MPALLSEMTPDRHVATRFRQTARLHAERVALAWPEGDGFATWTYAELAQAAAKTAAALRAQGLAAGHLVGLTAHRRPSVLAAMLAIWEVGAAFAPLHPQDPAARRAKALELVGAASALELDAAGAEPRLRSFPGRGEAAYAPSATEEELAYAMFTSGSSGVPKAVAVPHRAIVRLVTDQDYLPFGPERTFLQAAPLSFDASVLELWGPLLHGGRCVLYPDHELPTARGLRRVIQAQRVDTAWLTASLFHSVVDDDVNALRGLRHLVVGGEAVSPDHVRRVLGVLPETRIINGYGPTENTTFTTCYPVPEDFPAHASRVPIGWPLRGTSVRVIDEDLNPVPSGEEGELLVMGEGLARGYLGGAADDARFLHTTGPDGESVLAYRTGDRVVERPDGALEFLGRLDEQVKIAGYRIEPGECEVAIASAPGVRRCKVVCRRDPADRLRLIAYVVAPEDALAGARERAAETLPQHLIPHSWVRMDELPHTANGKLDLDHLPLPWRATPAVEVPVGSHALAGVLRCWAEVLGEPPTRVDVGLFETGARSIDAMRLQTKLEQASGLELEPTFVFEFVTVRKQTDELEVRGARFRDAHAELGHRPEQSR